MKHPYTVVFMYANGMQVTFAHLYAEDIIEARTIGNAHLADQGWTCVSIQREDL